MVQENPTAPETLEGPPLPTAAPEALPTPEQGAAEPPVTAANEEAAPVPDAGEVAPTPEAPAFDPYEYLERPEVKAILGPRDQRIEQRLIGEYNQRLEAVTKDWESTQTHRTINGLFGSLAQRLDASDIEGSDRVLSKIEKLREPYMEPYKKQQLDAGATATSTQMFSLLMRNLDTRGQDELLGVAGPGSQWEDIIDKFGALKQRGADDRAHKRLKDENAAAGAASQQVQQAREQGAVGALAPGSPAGSGRYTAEQWTVMTTNQRNQARAEGKHPHGAGPI